MDSHQLEIPGEFQTSTTETTTSASVIDENPENIDPTPNDPIWTFEDSLLSGLESVCGLFDNVYLLKTLGIISEDNVLYRRLNKGEWGSKLWFVTLLLSARKSFSRLLMSIRTKSRLKKEMNQLRIEGEEDLVKQVLRNKFTDALSKCSIIIKDVFLELLQTLAYLAIVVIEVFKINVSRKVIKFLEPLSYFISAIRIFTTGFATLTA